MMDGLAGGTTEPLADPSTPIPTSRAITRKRFTPLTLDQIAELPPPEWLIEGLLPEDGLAVLYGEPAAGKSFLALDWGLSIATRTRWLGREVRSGETVYIYAEGLRGLNRRAEAWKMEHGRDNAPCFWAVPVAVAIPDRSERQEFVHAVRSVSEGPKLIIVDTLARNFGSGNESLAQDMNAFIAGCDELRVAFAGTTVLVIHHSGKDKKKGARGSFALQGAADAVFALTRIGNTLRLVNEKQKDGEEAPALRLDLRRVYLADGTTSRVIGAAEMCNGPEDEKRGDPRIGKSDSAALAALASFGANGARAAEWQRAAVPGVGKTAFYEAKSRLLAEGQVRQDGVRYFAVEAQQSASS